MKTPMSFLSFGDEVKLIKPDWLIENKRAILKSSLEKYNVREK